MKTEASVQIGIMKEASRVEKTQFELLSDKRKFRNA